MRPELTQAAELLRRNTPQAIEEALGLLQNTVFSFSMKLCGHPEDAEDTMQEVLFRSLPHLARIEDPKALAVWLYTVTRNRCWRMRRKSAHAPQQMLSLDELMPSEAEMERLLQDPAESQEARLLHSEQRNLLRSAVLLLPAQLRIVLVLADMEDLSTDEVGQILGLLPGTVRVRLHRARLAVRKQMHALISLPEHKPTKPAPAKSKAKKRPFECRALFAQLSEYLDGRLEPVRCSEMERHIEACPACIAFLHDLRAAIDRCRSLDAPCDPAVAMRLRSMPTQEYLRLMGTPAEQS